MARVAFIGRKTDDALAWRWSVTVEACQITTYLD
jgi:hypothetical protein